MQGSDGPGAGDRTGEKKPKSGSTALMVFFNEAPVRPGLFFGFGAIETLDIDIALDRLRDILQQVA
nr:hypothetical protein GCM10020185_70130 [Pseudomonas brassicacearum subsp. brassicacearum]